LTLRNKKITGCSATWRHSVQRTMSLKWKRV